MDLTPCHGCGGQFPDIDGPTHRYMTSSPGCWAWYGDVLAREYSDFRYGKVHQLTVDAYAVQHPGTPSPQSIQSVAVHLISLCAVLEHGTDLHRASQVKQAAAQGKERFTWLSPPPSMGEITVADVHRAENAQEHAQWVRTWAKATWDAWSAHHDTVRTWFSETV